MMNQMYGPGPRGNRGGRGHFQPNRYHSRHPHPNFKNANFHQNNNNNNNNNPKCYNQNIDHCPNPNMEQGEFANDRMFANAGGNAAYLGNEAAYSMEPMYHGHGPPVVFDMAQFGQPHFADVSIPPPMVPQMQMVNYPAAPYMQSNVVYGVYSQPGMPPGPQEPFAAMKDGTPRSQSRESFGGQETDLIDCRPLAPNEYVAPQVPNCANCAGNVARSAATIRELQTDIAALHTKNRELLEENASLAGKLETLSTKEGPVVAAEQKTGLSADAEPFVAKPSAGYESCAAGRGQKWPPDPVDQGFEKTCTELIEIIQDKPGEAWDTPVQTPTSTPVQAPPPEIPVVSANGVTKWSEMLDTEADAAPESPSDFNSRGRVPQDDQGRQSGLHRPPQGRGHSYHDNQFGRGPMHRQDGKRNQNQGQQHQNRGLNSHQPPDRAGDFPNMRGSGPGNRRGRGFHSDQRQGTQSRASEPNWRSIRSSESHDAEPGNPDRKGGDEGQEVKPEERLEERKPGNRDESQERPKGGSGDRLRSQGPTVNDTRKSKKTKRKKK